LPKLTQVQRVFGTVLIEAVGVGELVVLETEREILNEMGFRHFLNHYVILRIVKKEGEVTWHCESFAKKIYFVLKVCEGFKLHTTDRYRKKIDSMKINLLVFTCNRISHHGLISLIIGNLA
jgi:hypothetical protein